MRNFIHKKKFKQMAMLFNDEKVSLEEMIEDLGVRINTMQLVNPNISGTISYFEYEKEELENELQMVKDQVYQQKCHIAGRIYWPATAYAEVKI